MFVALQSSQVLITVPSRARPASAIPIHLYLAVRTRLMFAMGFGPRWRPMAHPCRRRLRAARTAPAGQHQVLVPERQTTAISASAFLVRRESSRQHLRVPLSHLARFVLDPGGRYPHGLGSGGVGELPLAVPVAMAFHRTVASAKAAKKAGQPSAGKPSPGRLPDPS